MTYVKLISLYDKTYEGKEIFMNSFVCSINSKLFDKELFDKLDFSRLNITQKIFLD